MARPIDGADLRRQLLHRQAAGELRRELLAPASRCSHSVSAPENIDRDLLGPQPALEHPVARPVVLERLGKQVVEEQHLGLRFAHQRDEGVVLLLRAADPDDVVEEKVVAVGRREPLVGEVGPVHQHRPQLPDFGVGAQGSLRSDVHQSTLLS